MELYKFRIIIIIITITAARQLPRVQAEKQQVKSPVCHSILCKLPHLEMTKLYNRVCC